MGSQGFDLPKLAHSLEQLNAARTLEPIEPVTETDIPGFLKNERENTILSVIEESKKEVSHTFNRCVCVHARMCAHMILQ